MTFMGTSHGASVSSQWKAHVLVTCLLAVAKRPKKQLKEANFLRLTLQGYTVHHGEKIQSTRQLLTRHPQSANRKRRMLVLSSLPPFYSVQDPSSRDDAAQVQDGSSLLDRPLWKHSHHRERYVAHSLDVVPAPHCEIKYPLWKPEL